MIAEAVANMPLTSRNLLTITEAEGDIGTDNRLLSVIIGEEGDAVSRNDVRSIGRGSRRTARCVSIIVPRRLAKGRREGAVRSESPG